MGDTSIEWTQASWNPIRGCTPVSEGCRNCYAAGQAARFSGPGMPYEGLAEFTERGPRWTGKVRLVPERVADPLRWRKPKRIFVNSMSDLFHPALTDDTIACIFAVMQAAHRHTFQVLTKRPERMARLLSDPMWPYRVGQAFVALGIKVPKDGVAAFRPDGSLPNVWLGTSVENQEAADERIPHLLETPAAVRFLSCEPLLGPVDLNAMPGSRVDGCDDAAYDPLRGRGFDMEGDPGFHGPRIDWVIVGGESGFGARPMATEWARILRDQCKDAGVAFFFKQVGSRQALSSKKGGAEADIPADLLIREFP